MPIEAKSSKKTHDYKLNYTVTAQLLEIFHMPKPNLKLIFSQNSVQIEGFWIPYGGTLPNPPHCEDCTKIAKHKIQTLTL